MTVQNFNHVEHLKTAPDEHLQTDLYEQLDMSGFTRSSNSIAGLCSVEFGDSEPTKGKEEKSDDRPKKEGNDKADEKGSDKVESPEGSTRKKRLELEEAIKKADERMPAKDFDKTIAELHHLTLLWESKQTGSPFRPKKELDEKSTEIDPQGLTRTQMAEVTTATKALSDKLLAPIEARMRYAKFLADAGGFAEAEKVALEARELSERFAKPAKITEHIKVSPIEIEKQGFQNSTIATGFGLSQINPLRSYPFADSLTNTNVFLAKLYLGADVDWTKGAPEKLGDGRFFDPVKGFEAAEKARQSAADVRGYLLDPRVNLMAEIQNLYKAMNSVFQEPDSFKLSERKNSDGQKFDPERIKEIREKLVKIWQDPNNSSFLNQKDTGESLMRDLMIVPLGVWRSRPYAPPPPVKK